MKSAWPARIAIALALLSVLPVGAAGPPVPTRPPHRLTAPPVAPAPQPGAIRSVRSAPGVKTAATDLFRAGRPWIFSLFPHWWEEGTALSDIARADLVILPSDAALGDPSQLDRMVEENGNLRALVYVDALAVSAAGITTTYGSPIDPAWWLSRPATALSAPVSSSDTVMNVVDASKVSAGDDVLVDSENLKVLAKAGNALTVQRGYFSAPAPHAAGAAVKPHVIAWRDSSGTAAWALNLSPDAPRAPNGQRFLDFLVDTVEQKLTTSFFWSGVYLSPAYDSISWPDDGRADADGDGTADGVPKWDAGIRELISKLRARLGDTPIVGLGDDGGRLDLNGNVFDVFGPRGYDGVTEYGRWQQQLGSYLGWSGIERSPRVIAVQNSKAGPPDFRDARFSIGTALLGEGALSYEGGSDLLNATTWFDEYDDGGIGMGYLGEPDGPAQRVLPDLGANRLTNGGFENGIAGWGIWADTGYTVAQSFSKADTPAGLAQSIWLTPTAGTPWRASIAGPVLPVAKDHDYVITFWAKSASPRVLQLGVQQDASPWANRGEFQQFKLTTGWKEYTYSFTSSGDDPIARPMFWLGDSGVPLLLAGVTLREGNGDFWRREYSEGLVLVNGGSTSRTLNVGNGYRYIRGTQDPAANTGKQARTVTVPPYDARILVRTDEFPTEPVFSIYIPNGRR